MDDSLRAPRVRGTQWRAPTFVAMLFIYLALTLIILFNGPGLYLDQTVREWHLYTHNPAWQSPMWTYVMLGQRAPATLVALPWFVWLAWRFRTARPLLMLGTSLVVLNLSVGAVKVLTGRLGPHDTHKIDAVFAGGNIYPSGHTSNAVMLYGLIAMLAVEYGLRWRKTVVAAAALISVTIGLGTIFLVTHWVSDVLGGWLAGGLVLLALPTLMPYVERCYDAIAPRVLGWLRRVGPARRPADSLAMVLEPTPRDERVPANF